MKNNSALSRFQEILRELADILRSSLAVDLSGQDLRLWLTQTLPVLLIVYDAQKDRGYWLYLQAYFGTRRFRASRGSVQITIRIPATQLLDPAAVRQFAVYRARVVTQWEGRIDHRD